MPDRTYTILRAGSAYFVRIEPPVRGLPDNRTFATYREARGNAMGLRLSYGGRVVDRAETAVANG